jgi:methylated-DNA-[protein]-cysteine S-methyltransferase
MADTFFTLTPSPVGDLLLVRTGEGLTRIEFHGGRTKDLPLHEWTETTTPFQDTISQLQLYFSGKLKKFNLPLAPQGTPFQQSAWQALLDIPYGETRSYGDVARVIGRPKAVRAVGAANGQNPISIVIPCHRVVGSNGHLTGFGGGLDVKQQLLTLEGSLPQKKMFA